ncbi:MAG: hypothetical protein PHY47_24545 [Lachnospiraceae bacterium]|nr:hypothetical protein [Lachnospiraceae bacterium]
MKEIKRDHFSKEEFLNRMKTDILFSDEENIRNGKAQDLYINSEGQYVIGKEKTNFIFLSIKSSKVYGKKENQVKDIQIDIELLILRMEEKITLQLNQNEYYNEKWIKQIKTSLPLLISKNGYLKIINATKIDETENFYFQNIGIHQVAGKQYYVTSNCAITSEGIDRNIKSLQEGFNFEYDENKKDENKEDKNKEDKNKEDKNKEDENKDERDAAKIFLDYTNQNLKIFFPIHCISILAVIRNYLKEKEISAGAVLWIDGKVASGKTQLAMYAGDFFNRGNRWDDVVQHIHSPKSRKANIMRQLEECQNAVFILDDIKKEETVRNKENAKNNTDSIVRSIYFGKIDDEKEDDNNVNATGIITGEYFKEQTSTISRLLYMNIGTFLQNKDNSNDLKVLQKNKKYLANFMRYFIRWILIKRESDDDYFDKISIDYRDLKEELEEEFKNDISTRIIEIVATFQLVTTILVDYFKEKRPISNNDIEEFETESKKVIVDLGKNTLYKSLDYRPLIEEAFCYALGKLKIKDCRYGNSHLYYMKHENNRAYYIGKEKEIEREKGNIDLLKSNDIYIEKTWLMGLEGDGLIYTNSKNIDILLINKNVLINIIYIMMKEFSKRGNLEIHEADMGEKQILTILTYLHCLMTNKRTDGFDKVLNYPVYEKNDSNENEYEYEDEKFAYKESVVVVSVNTLYTKYIVNFEKKTIDNWFTNCKYIREHDWGRQFYDSENEKVDKAISKANTFLDLR